MKGQVITENGEFAKGLGDHFTVFWTQQDLHMGS